MAKKNKGTKLNLTNTEIKYLSALTELSKKNKKSVLQNMMDNFDGKLFKKIDITDEQIEYETNLDKIRDLLENIEDPRVKKSPRQETLEDIDVFLFKNKKIPIITRLETGLMALLAYYKEEIGEQELGIFLKKCKSIKIRRK